MVDNMNIDPVPQVSPEGVVAAPKSGIAGFVGSTTGKIVIGGVLLLIVLGAAAGIFLTFVVGQNAVPKINIPTGAVVASTTPAASEEESPTERPARGLTDSFAFRNVFLPTVSAPGTESATADGSTSTSSTGTGDTGTTPTAPENTLLLWKIETVDGKLLGTFIWNGATFTAGAGDRLGDTPWKVVSLSGTTAVMLFGDSRVTLTVGQGITK